MEPKILFIDDHPQWLQSYQALLNAEGYEVVTATNATDAMRVIERVSDLNFILTDLMLPHEELGTPEGSVGLQLLESIRNKWPSLPIVVLSAYLEPFGKELESLGVAALISKGSPNAITDILDWVRRALGNPRRHSRMDEEAGTLAKLRVMLLEEMNKYSPIRERTIYLPEERQFELIKPLVGFKREIENQLARFPFSRNVFLMMKFRPSNSELSEYIIENLASHGLCGVRADLDEWNITKNIYNPIAVLYCCKYGIALFDQPEEHQAYSANVAYELGMMHYQNKPCLILRHSSLPVVPFDLIKDLYVTYERDLQVRQIIKGWIRQVSTNP